MKKINDKQKQQVIELRKQGLGYKKIANKIDGLNRDNVRDFIKTKWFAENHPELVKLSVQKRNESITDKKIIELRNENQSYTQIGKNLGVTYDKVVYVSKKNGLGGQRGNNSGNTRPAKPEHNCEHCEVEFQRNSHNHVYCSDKCRYSSQPKNEKTVRTIHVKDCKNCKLKFVAIYGNRVYCTDKCRQGFYAKKRETKRILDTDQKCVVCKGKLPKWHSKVCSDKCFETRRLERSKNNRVERACQECGKQFLTNEKKQKFCSNECHADNQRIHPVATCERCGNEFASKPGRANKFCDRDCFLEHIGGKSWKTRKQGFNSARNRSHIRRAKRFGSDYKVIDIDKLYESNNWECQLCGKPVDKYEPFPSPDSASLDHIIPLSKGGTHTIDNVQLAHLGCNREKYDSLPADIENKQLTII